MIFPFYKYEGAGNDFMLIDNRLESFVPSMENIAFLCNRHFGIGADGLLLLENTRNDEDFSMRYYNSDGRESSMCGNGGRCITAFARRLLGEKKKYVFRAIDGIHESDIISTNGNHHTIRLKMAPVEKVEQRGNGYFLNTGSPHFVCFTDDTNAIDIIPQARSIRYDERLTSTEGANVNYVTFTDNGLLIRTYERGVEDETLACGTGAVAAAIAAKYHNGDLRENSHYICELHAKGGLLTVDFHYQNGLFSDIYLTGPATFVFEGIIEL